MNSIFRGAPSQQGCRLLQNRIYFKKSEEILKSVVYQSLLKETLLYKTYFPCYIINSLTEGSNMTFSRTFAASIFCTLKLLACTGIAMQSLDRAAVNGRTLEFGIDLDTSVAVIPRNIVFTAETPLGNGMSYTSKYGAVGIYCFDKIILMDGLNEKGLSVGAFYFPGYASYAKTTRWNKSKALSPLDFTNWVLTQFATTDEVEKALASVIITDTVFKDWGGGMPPPMHYIVYDKSGRSIVIEPLEGKLKVYENKIGVITNSPSFDWHLTNLNNYINLTPFNVTKGSIKALALHPFGQGSGMKGLPGDFTPPSRFVRASFFSKSASPAKNSREAVKETFHVLNQFDIPKGVVRGEDQGKTSFDYTMLTSVKDSLTLEYFYRTYNDQAIKSVNLKKFDLDAKEIKTLKTSGEQKIYDVTSTLRRL